MNLFNFGSIFSRGSMVVSGGSGSSASIGYTAGSVTVSLDGREVTIPAPAGQVEVRNGDIYQNGAIYKLDGVDESKVLRIAQMRIIVNEAVKGNISTSSGDIEVRGPVTGAVSSTSGNVNVSGGVDGDINSVSGDVKVDGEVKGSASTVSGDVKAHKFGSISSHRKF